MNDVFLKILNMSITASWLIIAVLLLRLVLRKSPKWINCLLWAIVALRLIMPFSIESIFSLVPSTETIETSVSKDTPIVIHSGIPAIDNNVHAYLKSNYNEPVNASTKQPIDVFEVISIIWLIGIPIMVLYGLISYIRVYKQVRISLLHEGNVYYCDNINSPFILGIIRPKIYIPSGISEEHVENIIKHEKAHLNRKDHWWKPLGFLLLTIYWFNPFIWVAYILLCRDIEAACDEKVIKTMDDAAKKDYSETLLSCSLQRRMILACPLAFGEVGVKDRIKAVLNYKKPAFWVIVVAVIASIIVAVCFLTNPKEEEKVETVQENNEKLDNNPATTKPDNIDVDENTSEISGSKVYEELVGRFRVNESMPEYKIIAYYSDESHSMLDSIQILDSESSKEIYKVYAQNCEIFTDKCAYTADINFDGNLDLIVPKEHPASATYFRAYVYNTEHNRFMLAPSFENLPNFIIDNENKRILTKRTASQITSYSMATYDYQLNDFVVTNSLYWMPDGDNTQLYEKRITSIYAQTIVQDLVIEDMDALNYDITKDGFSNYWKPGSFWDLDDEIWDNSFFLGNGTEPVEYIINPLFNSFLKGSIDAFDKDGNQITISEFHSNTSRKYAEFDMNGDNISELCIKTPTALTIFEIQNEKLLLWREDSPYCTILNNSAILHKRHGAAPEHNTYIYYEADSEGNTIYEISFEKYESTYVDDIYYPELYIVNNQEVSETEYNNKTKAILNIQDNLINWYDF